MAKPSSEANKQIAQTVRGVFGGAQFKVINYLDVAVVDNQSRPITSGELLAALPEVSVPSRPVIHFPVIEEV